MPEYSKLVTERNAWVAHNFPDQVNKRPIHSMIGVIEELGELAHSHLKRAQGIRENEDLTAQGKDSVGDMVVYMLGLMDTYGTPEYHPQGNITADRDLLMLRLADAVGYMSNAVVDDLSVLVRGAMSDTLDFIEQYCNAEDWDFEVIVQETWDSVKTRDWIKYPATGRPPVDAS